MNNVHKIYFSPLLMGVESLNSYLRLKEVLNAIDIVMVRVRTVFILDASWNITTDPIIAQSLLIRIRSASDFLIQMINTKRVNDQIGLNIYQPNHVLFLSKKPLELINDIIHKIQPMKKCYKFFAAYSTHIKCSLKKLVKIDEEKDIFFDCRTAHYSKPFIYCYSALNLTLEIALKAERIKHFLRIVLIRLFALNMWLSMKRQIMLTSNRRFTSYETDTSPPIIRKGSPPFD